MTLLELIDKLNVDLTREYAHWHFYMSAAVAVCGLHREEYQEYFLDEAKGEMEHIHEFGKLIMGLGGIPTTEVSYFSKTCRESWLASADDHAKWLLRRALELEEEVVRQYVQRMDDAEELEKNGGMDKVHGRYVHIFLEDQILDSRGAVDKLKEILR